ncbi:MAG: serine/threonine-protein kinase [Acidobacteria bacterium]|nr:serine/threonine-protein kinase [Acidobacteriota bacterium]
MISSGKLLGPYEIVDSLGAGGMGEVWRAKDTRLDREVAVKVLPSGFAENTAFLQRFEREAKAISSLNHPHICTLHDVGQADGTHYLVMELMEGESLADRLKRGPLPLHEVLRYGRQIASALDAAHRRGVIHRDLKPGNIMLTKSGAKLLDFGLAKSSGGQGVIEGLTSLPTEYKPLTQEGTILGTFQYMAPEQLEGTEADARTDIFALGAVLYEMATGRRAFQGGTKTSLIAAIVSQQPEPISDVTPMTPPALDHVVRRCLEKDPDDRWQSAHDIASELQWISEAGSQAGVGKAIQESRKSKRRLLGAAGLIGWLIAIAAISWALVERSKVEMTSRPFRAELVAPPEAGVAPVAVGNISISHDGSLILMLVDAGDDFMVAVRDLESGAVRTLEGTNGAIFPFWSPDGQWIGFFSDGRLKKVGSSGGAVQSLADAPQGRGGTWSSDGTIIFAPDIAGPLHAVPDSGGTARAVTRIDGERVTHRNPHILPGGRNVLFILRDNLADQYGSIAVASTGNLSQPRILVERASNPQYASGFLFWVREGNLLAQPFDPDSLELSASPKPIAEGIEYYNSRDMANYGVSGAGLIAWRRENRTTARLARYDWNGREVETFGEPGFLSIRDFSRDGRKVLLSREDGSRGGTDLWVMDLDRQQMTRATFTSSRRLVTGSFSPDGERIAISSSGGSRGWAGSSLWIQSASGSGEENRLLDSARFFVRQWSGDGRYLVGGIQETETGHDIGYLLIDEPEKLFKFVASPYDEYGVWLSPDGSWIAYGSAESGSYEIYLSDFPDGKRKWQISKGDSTGSAGWNLEGDALYYRSRSGFVRVRLTRDGDRLEPGTPELIELGTLPIIGEFKALGDSFITLATDGRDSEEPIRVIRNWQTLLGSAD